MSSGKEKHLTQTTGEYLVAAELCRRGILATTFTGNLPGYDILAVSNDNDKYCIQVKTIRGGNWQFDIRKFADVKLAGSKQIVGDFKKNIYDSIIYVFVYIASSTSGETGGLDRYFIILGEDLQKLVVSDYKERLKGWGGSRPKVHDTFHTALNRNDLKEYENNWAIFKQGG